MRKNIVFWQLVFLNIFIFLFGVLGMEILLSKELVETTGFSKENFVWIGLVVILIINVWIIFFTKGLLKDFSTIEQVLALNKMLKEGQKMGKIYAWQYDFNKDQIFLASELKYFFGIKKSNEITFKKIINSIEKEDRQLFITAFKKIFFEKKKEKFKFKTILNNKIRWFNSETEVFYQNGKPIKAIGVLQDITSIYKRDDYINNLSNILDESLTEIQLFDLETFLFLKVNKQSQRKLGFSEDEIVKMSPLDVLPNGFTKDGIINLLSPVFQGLSKSVMVETYQKTKDGLLYPVEIHFSLAKLEERKVVSAVIMDISERTENEKRLNFLAYNDVLTGFFNRNYAYSKLETLIQLKERFSLFYIDLDKFKKVNDERGHSIGNLVLKEIAFRIKNVLSDSSIMARWGGDEFVIILNETDESVLREKAEKIIKAITDKIQVENNWVLIACSIGIVSFPNNANNLEEILLGVDLAMRAAKKNGGNQYLEYDEDMLKKTKEHLKIEQNLKNSIEKKEGLLTHYQPKTDCFGNVVGAEALIRWTHPELGIVSPGIFVPIAEQSNIIINLGEVVLRDAAKKAKQLYLSGHKNFRIAVNVSGKQLKDCEDAKRLIDIIKEETCDPSFIELEITESMLLESNQQIIKMFKTLKEFGFKLALDDFGTGYSSLSYLHKFPLDYLKIDISFVNGLGKDESSERIVKTIIELGHGLGLKVVAEGVETAVQFNLLKELGCDYIQGFLISKPMSSDDFDKFWADNN